MKFFEKPIAQKEIYKGKLLTLSRDIVELPDGSQAVREHIAHPGGAVVVALTKDKELVLVKQYRYGAKEVLLELPAGKRDPEEEPMITAQRELEEETGFYAEHLDFLAKSYPTPGYDSELLWIYYAHDIVMKEQKLDAGEFLSVELIPLDEAVRYCLDGRIEDSKTQAGILTYWVKFRGEWNRD